MLPGHRRKSNIATLAGAYLGLSSNVIAASAMGKDELMGPLAIFIFAMLLMLYGGYHTVKGRGYSLWQLLWLFAFVPGGMLIYCLPDRIPEKDAEAGQQPEMLSENTRAESEPGNADRVHDRYDPIQEKAFSK